MLGQGRVVSASHDGTLRLWDVASGAEVATAAGHTGPVAAVAVGAEESWLASAGFDHTVQLWQTPA